MQAARLEASNSPETILKTPSFTACPRPEIKSKTIVSNCKIRKRSYDIRTTRRAIRVEQVASRIRYLNVAGMAIGGHSSCPAADAGIVKVRAPIA